MDMLRDQGKAQTLLRENIELAAKTPFEFREISSYDNFESC